jgi:diacylglycerol kinase (ATP)
VTVSATESVPRGESRNSQRTRTRALLIVNRCARHGQAGPGVAVDRLRQAGFELIEQNVEHAHHLSQIIREARGRVDAVILGGGDGTLSHAADGLVDAQLPLGILPMGTANDLARTLGLPTDLAAAADIIIQGHQKRIDLGWVNGTHFFNVATVGLGAAVTRRLSHERKGRWGVFAYLFATASSLMRARPFTADIRTETETIRVRTVQVTVGNGKYYGGGMVVDDTSTIDDGVLHLFSLEVKHWWQMIPLLPALRRGTLRGSTHVRTLCGREFELLPIKKRHKKLTADGEISGRTPAQFRVIPHALSVFVPEAEPAVE